MSRKILFGCLALLLLWGCSGESTAPPYSPPPYMTGYGFWERYGTDAQDAYDDEWYFDYYDYDYDDNYYDPYEDYHFGYDYFDSGPDRYEWEDWGIFD